VDNQQDDVYAARRAELAAQFQGLPSAGSDGYWRRIEELDAANRLPLEVLTRCFRERHFAGFSGDADGIMRIIWRRVQPQVIAWARDLARQAPAGMAPALKDDLEEECLISLWEELVEDDAEEDAPFLLTSFKASFLRLRQHVAQDVMTREGIWKRPGVNTPKRIPRGDLVSLQAEPDQTAGSAAPPARQPGDPAAQRALEQVELSDLFEKVQALPENQRTVILDRFWEGVAQEETAAKLGVSTRMVRYLLGQALEALGQDYGGGEEGNGV
jgi:RNA polymerase sigma factor (sigma-70 family)